MYARSTKGLLIVKNAWMIPQLPMSIVVEMPDGELKFFGVTRTPHPPSPADKDLRPYKGYHPATIPTAESISDARLMVFGVTKQKQPGTKPDTSLYLGDERRAWLIEQGGIQPTIQKLVDEAMGE